MNDTGPPDSMHPIKPGIPPLVRMAAWSGVAPTISRYLQQGGSPDALDDDGRTLLLMAATRGYAQICRLLLEAGASPCLVDKNGNDALTAAAASGHSEIVAAIQDYLRAWSTEISPLVVSDNRICPDGDWISVDIDQDEGVLPNASCWEVEKDVPLPAYMDGSCQSMAESMHCRITRHRVIDNDEDWSDVEIVLPILRKGNLQFSFLDGETLSGVSRLLQHGKACGWVPSHWLETLVHAGMERDQEDLCIRLEMLLGEYAIQVEDAPVWLDIPWDEIDADASDLSPEVISFLDDLAPWKRDPLSSYFHDLALLPLLDLDQERSFGRMWQQDRNPDGLRRLVEGNLRFVVKEANRFQGLGLEIQDLVSEGNLGLLEGASRFDPERGNRFLTYAAWWIRQSIFHALAEQGGRFRLPQKVAGNVAQLNRIVSQLANDLGREPTPEEITAEGTFTGKELDRLLPIRQTANIDSSKNEGHSWSAPDDQTPCMDPGPESTLDSEEFDEQIRRALAMLNDRERDIIIRHFGFGNHAPETLEVIGQNFAPPISRERVRQIEERALEKLRDRRRRLLEPYLEQSPFLWFCTFSNRHAPQEDEDDA